MNSNGDGTVTDTRTGLMWEQCPLGLSGAGCTEGTAERQPWNVALRLSDIANVGVGRKGYTDWRLPNKNELESLVDLSRMNPALDASVFPNTPADWFWSSTVNVNNYGEAWYVEFNNGGVSTTGHGNAGYVRLVRGGNFVDITAFPPPSPFTTNPNGTVTDTRTGLIWDRCVWGAEGSDCASGLQEAATWQRALAVSSSINGMGGYKGHTDWRLPNKNELESLIDLERASPAIDSGVFPGTPNESFWSSTSNAESPSNAWAVEFAYGSVTIIPITSTAKLRLVRGETGHYDLLGDITPPVLSAVTVSLRTRTSIAINVTSDQAATGYWLVVPRGAKAPRASQIIAGVNYEGIAITASGSAAINANTPATFSISGLASGSSFDVFFVAVDSSNNANSSAVLGPVAVATSEGLASWEVKYLSETRAAIFPGGKVDSNGPDGENNWGPFEWEPGSAALDFAVTLDMTLGAIPVTSRSKLNGIAVTDPTTELANGEQFSGIYNHRSVLCTWLSGNTGEGSASCIYPDVPTHLLYSPEDAVPGPIGQPLKKPGAALDSRIPVILVHGWQGSAGGVIYDRNASIGPASQLSPEAVGNDATVRAHDYWANLRAFFDLPEQKAKYKIWVYKYPSYKHVTFNARLLKDLIQTNPELSNRTGLVFVAHSMGALVTRSLFEEHGFDHAKADKIVLLDGVNHGSPAAITNMVALNNAAKNLATLGANDIQWDFYDGINVGEKRSDMIKIMTGEDVLHEVGIYELQTSQLSTVLHDGYYSGPVNFMNGIEMLTGTGMATYAALQTNPDQFVSPLYQDQQKRLGETYEFDNYFRSKIDTFSGGTLPIIDMARQSPYALNSITNVARSVIVTRLNASSVAVQPAVINPWLLHLNLAHQVTPTSYRGKIYAYSGIDFRSGEVVGMNLELLRGKIIGFGVPILNEYHAVLDKGSRTNSDWTFSLAAAGVENIGTAGVINYSFGYLNDGPVPTSSALLDSHKAYDTLLASTYSCDVCYPPLLGAHATIYPRIVADAHLGYIFGIRRLDPLQHTGTDPYSDYAGDGYVHHRLIQDYNHDMALKGCYRNSPNELTGPNNENSRYWGDDSCWADDPKNYASPTRKSYIVQAFGALPPGGITNDKLTQEPLFMSILRDITSDKAPGAPTLLAVVPDGSGSVLASFTAPGNHGASAITQYYVTCIAAEQPIIGLSGTASPIKVMNMTNNVPYNCSVTALNDSAYGAGPSSRAILVTPMVPVKPGPPTLTRLIPGNNSMRVVFTTPTSNGGSAITGYTASCNSGGGAPITKSGTGSPITVTGLTNGVNYTCTVSATNSVGTGSASLGVSKVVRPASIAPILNILLD